MDITAIATTTSCVKGTALCFVLLTKEFIEHCREQNLHSVDTLSHCACKLYDPLSCQGAFWERDLHFAIMVYATAHASHTIFCYVEGIASRHCLQYAITHWPKKTVE